MLPYGVGLLILGLLIEAIMGSFRKLFDWYWPFERYRETGEYMKVYAGRAFIIGGLTLTIFGGIMSL
jgi:hypothetical protein